MVQWLRDEMKLISNAAETDAIARSVPDTGGVCFVPAFVGLGAPHWDSDCRGMIYGITRGTNRAHIVRAALEAIAFQVFDVVHAMEQDVRKSIGRLCVDGGASANDFLMQFQSDILDAQVVRPAVAETTGARRRVSGGTVQRIFPRSGRTERLRRWRAYVPPPHERRRPHRKTAAVGRSAATGIV